jgi:hypothetical protein
MMSLIPELFILVVRADGTKPPRPLAEGHVARDHLQFWASALGVRGASLSNVSRLLRPACLRRHWPFIINNTGTIVVPSIITWVSSPLGNRKFLWGSV